MPRVAREHCAGSSASAGRVEPVGLDGQQERKRHVFDGQGAGSESSRFRGAGGQLRLSGGRGGSGALSFGVQPGCSRCNEKRQDHREESTESTVGAGSRTRPVLGLSELTLGDRLRGVQEGALDARE